MGNIKKISLIAMIAMAVLSFTNLFGAQIAGASVILGVIFFFVNKAIEKQDFGDSGLDFKAIGANLKDKSIWFWIALPLIMDIVSMTLGNFLVPGYIEHVLDRAGVLVSYENIALSIIQMIVLALGEEIAWRAFFQKQLQKAMPITPVLVLSAVLFGIGHFSNGPAHIVAFDVFFVAVNSVLYGIIFMKTNNAWISTISHFAANLFSIIVLVFI